MADVTTCDWCGRTFERRLTYKTDSKGFFGATKYFCSAKCHKEWKESS